MTLFINLALNRYATVKCEDNIFEEIPVEANKPFNENIMNILSSVTLGQSVKREKNVLSNLASYTQLLKLVSSLDSQDEEYEGLFHINTTKKRSNNKQFEIIYSPKKTYKNNVNDVKKEINKTLFG
ncbi:conserved Plasmodium protein, unknown function [Plasmodium malariae]|nr:conserved Plasmodium protein, unknown function [Plasmodium malariae]SBT86261.1 conserved Plasmodium protein, unknown function [Plasmodium malariae]